MHLLMRLETKGLQISNVSAAERALGTVGYYRLLIYMRPFQDNTKQFVFNSRFEDILELYEFDRRLRLLCLDAIERVEVALRASIVNSLAVIYGPHFYTDPSHFTNVDACMKFIDRIRNSDHFGIMHYQSNYSYPLNPPIWVMLEAAPFGATSRVFADLTLKNRKVVSRIFGYDESVLVSWFRTLTVLRNLCAHHSRLWNSTFTVNRPKAAKSLNHVFVRTDSIHARLVILAALLNQIDSTSEWKIKLIQLLESAPKIAKPSALGFPDDWREEPFWK
jgi:abortive infection bacteriophage resistance protein